MTEAWKRIATPFHRRGFCGGSNSCGLRGSCGANRDLSNRVARDVRRQHPDTILQDIREFLLSLSCLNCESCTQSRAAASAISAESAASLCHSSYIPRLLGATSQPSRAAGFQVAADSADSAEPAVLVRTMSLDALDANQSTSPFRRTAKRPSRTRRHTPRYLRDPQQVVGGREVRGTLCSAPRQPVVRSKRLRCFVETRRLKSAAGPKFSSKPTSIPDARR